MPQEKADSPIKPPAETPRLRRWWAALSFRARLLGTIWLVFAILVAARIHGSSISLSARLWAPEEADHHFLAEPLLKALGDKADEYSSLLMAKARSTRSDEYATSTLWSLAQFTHRPPFPVRNTNVGLAQNMLLVSWVPVLHPATLARPVTWGYLCLGPYRGLAWLWWFAPFFCFTMLYLALEIVFPGRRLLPAFGAFWCCASAYTVCWSHFPSYAVGFAAMGMVCAHHLLAARSRRAAVLFGLATGYAAAGFIMQLYPPWMIPLGYSFAAILVGLAIRDRPWRGVIPRDMALGWAVAVATAAAILACFVLAVLPELHAIAASAYPGLRRLNGGDLTWARLFGAAYNSHTIRSAPSKTMNPSEWAGFFLFYPTVLFAVILSRRARRRMDPVAWALLGLETFMVLFCKFKLPQWLANITLWSHVPTYRGQLAIGVVSIVLSLYLLRPDPKPTPYTWKDVLAGVVVVLATAGFYLWVGASIQKLHKIFPEMHGLVGGPIWAITAAMALGAALLVLSWRRTFTTLLAIALVLVAGNFNPLSVSFPSVERSELRQAVRRTVAADTGGDQARKSLWLGFGGPSQPLIGTVLSAMGARSLTGVLFHPQLDLWHPLDPSRDSEEKYNRYAEVHYFQDPVGDQSIRFTNPSVGNFNIHASADNPALRNLGVRFALSYQKDGYLKDPPFQRLYESEDRRFRIWQIP